ncbi:MAG: hypothetical protein WDW36_004027 [Sanguina aurantia]
MRPALPPTDRLQQRVTHWLGLARSAAAMEALLRDNRMRGACIQQHGAASIALMVLCAPCFSTQPAIRTRISLAATLRKLMHPASAPSWAAASGGRLHGALSKRSWERNTFLDDSITQQQGWPVVDLFTPVVSETVRCISTHIVQMSTILAATHLQLCVCTGSEKRGGLLEGTARRAGVESAGGRAVWLASSWEGFAIADLSGRLLPGCSHWGCTNLEGGAEAALPTRLCSGCRRARYCCDECQRAAWVGGHREVKIALCQLSVGTDKAVNISNAQRAIKEAARAGAGLVVLPEMWNCPYSNASFPAYAEDIEAGGSPSVSAMSQCARELSITLVAGSIPERSGGRLYNTCMVFGTGGEVLGKHRKVHLFDIDIPGKMTFKESLTLSPGDSPTVVDTAVGRLGIGICYDLRFPELAMIYANRGVQLIVYPGAFNTVTGPLHWELLQRGRALDNQLFVATCSPSRSGDPAAYQAWGHSTVVGPFAEVLATTGHDETTVHAELDFGQIVERRGAIPVQVQKRYDLYQVVDKSL